MGKFLLPAFHGEGGEPTPQGGRGWEVFPMSDLEKFASALAAPKDMLPNLFVDAIPDVWGKALLFAYSLQDERHTLHQRSVDAFRGFLAMLALRHTHKYDVNVVRVDIAMLGGSLPFASAISKLLPLGAITENVGWDPAYLFLIDTEVVGICSPLTLIAPREGSDMTKASARQLTDGFRFKDPTGGLGSRDCAAVRDWLMGLESSVMEKAPEAGIWRSVVTSQIAAFKNALTQKASDISPQPVRYAQGDRVIQTDLFSYLGKAVDSAPAQVSQSRFQLQSSANPPYQLIVIDEEMIRNLPPDTEIAHGITASVLRNQPLGNDQTHLGRHELPPGWKWVRRDYFFLPRLSIIQTRDAFVNVAEIPVHQRNATDGSPLPPLRSEISEYLDATYVSKNSWFERTVDGFTFKLHLPICAGQPALTASKSYRFSELNGIDAYDMPVTEIWPSTKLEGWKLFYTFWARDAENSKIYLQPCGVPIEKSKVEINRSTREEVTLTKVAPAYLACFEIKDTPAGIQKEPLGLLMPSYGEPTTTQKPKPFNVGFDFGTTNTYVFISGGKDETYPLTLSGETVRIFRNENPKREGLMYRLFLPAGKEPAPFLSLVRRRARLAGGFEPIRDAHVLFYHQQVENAQFEDPAVESYLKWDHSLNDDRSAFLKQLVLHATYQARLLGAEKVRFIYSYPTAFDERTNEVLEAFWTLEVPKMKDSVGVGCEFASKQTESIATAYYFNNIGGGKAALLGTGALVLDIGGGTTDISAWRKNKLEIQTSVRLSGREILLGPMLEKKDYVLPMLASCMEDGKAIFDPLGALENGRFYRRADAILRTSGEELLRRLPSLMGSENFERFRSEIAVRATALLYYAGMLLGRTGWAESGATLPDVYIGGNGCRVFNWLAPPEYHANHAVSGLLISAYASGARATQPLPHDVKLILSQDPKSEVARGLVYSLDNRLAAPDEAVQTIAGEGFETLGGPQGATNSLTAEILRKGVRLARASEVENVLNIYNKFADRAGAILLPVNNAPVVINRATDEINNWAHEQTGRDSKEIEVEPLFIVGVARAFSLIEWRVSASHAASG